MPDRFTPEEFQELMKRWDETEKRVIQERLSRNFSRPELRQFSQDEAATIAAVLQRLIPQDEGVDLIGFLDWATGLPLGRGDRQTGMPDEPELFRLGLRGIDETSQARYGRRFRDLAGEQQDAVLQAIQEGLTEGEVWGRIPGKYFFIRFYGKALMGYFAHPRAWMRIGFPGPSYPGGYLWVGLSEALQRHRRKAGWSFL